MAALLLLHRPSRVWTIRLPRQHCGSNAARWLATEADFPDLGDDWYLGGTFQVRVLCHARARAGDCVPVADGLHLVHAIRTDGRRQRLVFVRADSDLLRSGCSGQVIRCDLTDAIAAAMPRLRLV